LETSEFTAALAEYLPDGERPDGRPAMVAAMLKLSADDLVTAYLDMPGDLAAMFSGCLVPTSNNEAIVSAGEIEGDDELVDFVAACEARADLPLLKPAPDHPVAALLNGLRQTPGVCRLLVSVTALLAWMRTQPEFRPFMWRK